MACWPVLAMLGLSVIAHPAAAQSPQACAASSDTPRTAAEVQAAVLAHRCAPGTRLRVAMTVAGQAIVLQQTGLCAPDSFRTMSRQVADGSRVLGVTCTLAAR